MPGAEEKAAAPRWGDTDFEDSDEGGSLPQSYETEPDANGIRLIVEYKTKPDGKKVKITKKVRITEKIRKVNRGVEERKKWRKFGDCAAAGAGVEAGITNVGDEIQFELHDIKKSKDKSEKETISLGIICRYCGATGDHWTHRCPHRHKYDAPGSISEGKLTRPTPIGGAPQSEGESSSTPGLSPAKGGYVIPAMRGGSRGSSEGEKMMSKTGRGADEATVRVTNLSEDVSEGNLQELFAPFGRIQRIYLAKDKGSGLSKGFAFVTFYHKEDAANAIEKLSGVGYDHLILHVEWARPSGAKGDRY